jgi:hypothetical protein
VDGPAAGAKKRTIVADPKVDLSADSDNDLIPDVIDPNPQHPAAVTTQGIDKMEITRQVSAGADGDTRKATVKTEGGFVDGGNLVESTFETSRTQLLRTDGGEQDVVQTKGDTTYPDHKIHIEATALEEQGPGLDRSVRSSLKTDSGMDGKELDRQQDSVETVNGRVVSERHVHTGPDAANGRGDRNPFDFGNLGAAPATPEQPGDYNVPGGDGQATPGNEDQSPTAEI